MNRRRLALKVALVSIVAAAGVGIAATPAVAMPIDCWTFNYWHNRADYWLHQPGLTPAQYAQWYELWLRTEVLLAKNC